ncbi:LuxR C-terminal-related transcriptional regulator [Kitasatospora sp. NPDC089509]|uniref:LuxR C-terminal-related transcriptional regulator n=1 Tax=Kitasatospora sp. NPDC089509 TaxID=3364079 RepID=UPI0038215159
MPLKVMIVGRDTATWERLRIAIDLTPDLHCVGAHPWREFEAQARVLRPQVVLIGADDLSSIRYAHDLPDPPAVAVLTAPDCQPDFPATALQAGARGILMKPTPQDLICALRILGRGGMVFHPPAIWIALLKHLRCPCSANSSQSPPHLTPREYSVLTLLCAGLRNARIARQLDLDTSTVKNHVNMILAKLGAVDRTQAAVLADRLGLIVDPAPTEPLAPLPTESARSADPPHA